jgi:integrase/recombinase XerD
MIDNFKKHLNRLGYGKGSQKMLPTCVLEFLQELQKQNIDQVSKITKEHILKHYNYLQERPNKRRSGGLSSKMIYHHIYSIRLFFNYLEKTGAITKNPISNLKFPKPEQKEREILTKDEIKLLYQNTQTAREKAILGVFYGCGLRRNEGVKLNLEDVNLKEKLLYVRHGKGNKKRTIPINETIIEDFKQYIFTERHTRNNEKAFITNKLGRRTQGNSFNETLKKLLKESKIIKEISLHNLRHSIATHLLESGMGIESVRDFLGHKHLEATQIYTRVTNLKHFGL